MALAEDTDDPNNVKPLPIKVSDGRPPREKDTPKESGGSKTRMTCEGGRGRRENLRKPASPAGKTPHPMLKLNEFAKNCAEADSSDSNCDFVKKVNYLSDAVSSASCIEVKGNEGKGKQRQVSQMKRADAVKASVSKEVKERKRDDSKEKEGKERKESKDKVKETATREKVKETPARDKVKETATREKVKESPTKKESAQKKDGHRLKASKEAGSKGRDSPYRKHGSKTDSKGKKEKKERDKEAKKKKK